MLKSTHNKYVRELDFAHERRRMDLLIAKVDITNVMRENRLLHSQIDNLEKQLKEAKRRDNKGRFVTHKDVMDDFLTRS